MIPRHLAPVSTFQSHNHKSDAQRHANDLHATPESIAAALADRARERAAVEAATGCVFVGDRLVTRAEEYDRLAQVIADAITRASHARLN